MSQPVFNAQDAANHRRCANVARRMLDARRSLRWGIAMGQIEGEPGSLEVDRQLEDRERWHTSMAERIEGLLGLEYDPTPRVDVMLEGGAGA